MIDWKTLIDESHVNERLGRCMIQSDIDTERTAFTSILPDGIFYLSPSFRDKILYRVVTKANGAYRQLLRTDPNFKGKVAFVCHSLAQLSRTTS